MRRSACGTGSGGAMMTFAIGFTDNLSCNSDLKFFYVFDFQIPDEEECLRDRKWWCFLLSSMLTFAMGVTGVLVIRLLKFVFCREVSQSPAFSPREEGLKERHAHAPSSEFYPDPPPPFLRQITQPEPEFLNF